MLYALLCYNDENTVWALDKAQDDEVMARLDVVRKRLETSGKMGPSLRLLPTTAATTLRKSDPPLVIDGPFAETKEQTPMCEFTTLPIAAAAFGPRKTAKLKASVSLNRLFDSLVSIAAVGLVLTLASATAFLGV